MSQNAANYADLHAKLVKSFAADCLSLPVNPVESAENLAIDAWKTLRDLSTSTESIVQPVGLGTDIRYDGQNIGAAALVYQESAVHITIFAKHNIADETRASDVRNEFNVGENLRRTRHF